MLFLGMLLFVILTFAAALIAGVGVLTALVVAAVTTGALFPSQRHAGGPDIRS
jgi:hypothetical protein